MNSVKNNEAIESIKSAINGAISNLNITDEIDDRKKWYRQSYPFIINAIDVNKSKNFKEAVIMAKISTASWVAHICKGEVVDSDIKELMNYFKDKGKIINNKDGKDSNFYNLIKLCNRIVNSNPNSTSNIPTISKFLHFLEPSTFPILDKQVADKLGLKTNIKNYQNYIQAILSLKNDSKLWDSLNKKANNEKITVIRLIDQMVFG